MIYSGSTSHSNFQLFSFRSSSFFNKRSSFEVGRYSSTSCSNLHWCPYRGVHSEPLSYLTTMPRQKRPAFEVAVAASPLFKLALEVRIMIYEMLLIQEGGMFIPCDVFTRRNCKREGSVPYECSLCGLVFQSYDGCDKHIAKLHRRYTGLKFHALTEPLLPDVSTSLLQTCRIIRLEAGPILYSRNSFYFCDPATASNFRWTTDCAQAGAVQEMGIKMGFSMTTLRPWQSYVAKGSLSLGRDFPNLRRMTINLCFWGGADFLRSMKRFRETSQGLDWLLLLKLPIINRMIVLDCLEQLVAKEDDPSKGKKEVRRHIWAPSSNHAREDALLWWGSRGEAVPHKYRTIGDQPQQEASSELIEG